MTRYPLALHSDRGDIEHAHECLREQNHDEPHVHVRSDGQYFAWMTYWECPCEDNDCDGDWCILYTRITTDEAKALINNEMHSSKLDDRSWFLATSLD